jgi:hypothetical protein
MGDVLGPRHAALDATDHAGADALAKAETAGELMGVWHDIDERCDEHGTGG